MPLARQHLQHPRGVGGVGRFAQNLPVHHHDRVRRDDRPPMRPREHAAGLGVGDALDVLFRGLAVVHRFVDVGGHRVEVDAGRTQQFGASG
jgi:hypothetical protein